MIFSVDWDDAERSVILCRVEGAWTWDDFTTLVQAAYRLAGTVDYWVNVIIEDVARVQIPPTDLVRQLRWVLAQRPRNMGLLILVGANTTLRATAHLISHMYPYGGVEVLRFANTVESARNEARMACC
ncbi:MAG: hypothetical protein JXA10_04250 [Anaerolineae bacterium]|nr:hypothetical protein [Anaerolineae bacterium]